MKLHKKLYNPVMMRACWEIFSKSQHSSLVSFKEAYKSFSAEYYDMISETFNIHLPELFSFFLNEYKPKTRAPKKKENNSKQLKLWMLD
ncbi:MAG: hypothetical protein KatS3mg101_1175 [Patescibacteria group bacterium]|nr:MAG: hypothetical protein KatS3mg101_1175 [Patescibacteria group bacterium]